MCTVLFICKWLSIHLHLNEHHNLNAIVQRIRFLFDVDAPIAVIDAQLASEVGDFVDYLPGLRVPGIWGTFEAGVRAILGQQVSVAAARNLVITFVEHLGQEIALADAPVSEDDSSFRLFPTPAAVVNHPLDFFRMPQSRKDTIRRLAEHFLTAEDPD